MHLRQRILFIVACPFLAISPAMATDETAPVDHPDLVGMVAQPVSPMATVIERYEADRGALERKYSVRPSTSRRERMLRFQDGWLAALEAIDFEHLSHDAQVDWLLLRNTIRRERSRSEIEAKAFDDAATFLPFATTIIALAESRETIPAPSPQDAADRLTSLAAAVREAERVQRDAIDKADEAHPRPTPAACRRALLFLEGLRSDLAAWQRFRDGYDPTFTWWTAAPYKDAETALESYATMLRERGVGRTSDKPDVIVGTPIGREALLAELAFEWIPYSPEELLAIADREFAWCEVQLRKAAAEMGCGDDWKRALEQIKREYVAPGEQPAVIRELAKEAIAFLKERDLVSVPPIVEETWRMEMMTPQRQLITPFFTGGEVISVSFPTSSMSHEQKLMSLRGNNIYFARATVYHELVPGHHLQQYAESRFKTHREPFGTSFWTEGWALHWEMLMWDQGFGDTPQRRVAMLFWRIHRAARILFSLRYQLGEMSPQECVDFLVERVGHERANAEGEVRRSISGDYGPLYQAAYMVGGLQFRALHKELVGSGTMTDRAFHDAILREHNIPVEFVRAILIRQPLTRDMQSTWRFDEALQEVQSK